MRALLAVIAAATCGGCMHAPLVSKHYAPVTHVTIMSSNVTWTVEALIEKDYNAELKGSLK